MSDEQKNTISRSQATSSDSPSPSTNQEGPSPEATEYPPFRTVLVVLFGVFICSFLVSLDRTIVGTAIPTITDEFDSLGDVGWYASAYLLSMCGFQLLFGRAYTFFNVKTVYLISIVVFEIGSAICGAAPNSNVFIFGRAIAGAGSASMFSGAIPIFMYLLPLEKRPMWTGIFAMVFGVSSIIAPLLGGAFTDTISWRWCFYINLPLGAITFVIIMLVLQSPPRKVEAAPWKQQLDQLDPIGTIVFLPCIVCLLLALQFGGVTYPWNSPRVISLLVLFGVLLLVFLYIQFRRQDLATIPPRILANRSVKAALLFTFCLGSSNMIIIYFLPLWFQAIKGASALHSGIMNIPMVTAMIIGAFTGGFLTKKTGYYVPWMYASAILMPVGAGLLSTFTVTTGHAKWIGYQVVFGLGIGLGMQQPSMAIQTVLDPKDVPTGISLVFLLQSLGGAIFTSLSNSIFGNKLAAGLTSIPGVDIDMVAHLGATDLRSFASAEVLPAVLGVYNVALMYAFYVAVGLSAVAVVGAVSMEWRSIKKGEGNGNGEDVSKEEKEPDVEV